PFSFQAEDGIRDRNVTGVQTCALPIFVTITLALFFYTVGVFSERRAHSLQKRHVILFWCGLVFDTTGTTIMSTIAHGSSLLSPQDRKSTRLNSSHVSISYAVFCLKKKN